MAEESAIRCCTSTTRDLKTVAGRIEHEGLSFLTITLPTFGKDFEKSLDLGYVDRRLFSSFRRKAELPRFLGGFLDRVFDRDSGLLLTDPCIDSILAIRQLTLMFGKISLPCSDARTRKAMRGFVLCEQDVRDADAMRSTQQRADFRRISSLLFASMFTKIDSDIYHGDYWPKHGPGYTADRILGNQKYVPRTWTSRLDQIFRVEEMIIPNSRYYDSLDQVDILEPGSETPVKVVSVPKTLKTPRIIAMEPVAMQYAQQSVLGLIRKYLEEDDSLSRLIGIPDQEPNQALAREGSLYGMLATLDMSDASDRVSNQLVREMFGPWPWLNKAVDASRSRKAEVPDHGVIRLAKFASMGSALTFPVEAMVFLTMIFMGIERELNRPLGRKDINYFCGKVRVYGDDIIVPVDYVHTVVQVLEDFGSRVNQGKSFWTGRFRESCGREYFAGQDVSIVRVRDLLPTQRQHATRFVSLVAFRNQLYFAGYWQTCRWIDDLIRKVFRHFPVVDSSSRVLGRHSFLGYESQRMDTQLHSPLVKGFVIKAQPPRDFLDEEGALLKCLLSMGQSIDDSSVPLTPKMEWRRRLDRAIVPTQADEDHLERAGRPKRVDIKLGWYSPF